MTMQMAPGGMGFAPDIEDREERDQWVKDTSRKIFLKHGDMIRTLILRTPPRLTIMQIMEGRLIHLLPPEAYLAAGKAMPTT